VVFSKVIAHNAISSYLDQVKSLKGKKISLIKDVELPTSIAWGFINGTHYRDVCGVGIIISFSQNLFKSKLVIGKGTNFIAKLLVM